MKFPGLDQTLTHTTTSLLLLEDAFEWAQVNNYLHDTENNIINILYSCKTIFLFNYEGFPQASPMLPILKYDHNSLLFLFMFSVNQRCKVLVSSKLLD